MLEGSQLTAASTFWRSRPELNIWAMFYVTQRWSQSAITGYKPAGEDFACAQDEMTHPAQLDVILARK